MKKEDNWWKDPKNKEEVERISWWDHEENKATVPFPIAIVKSGSGYVASTGTASERLLGDGFTGVAQGETREEAIKKLFDMIKWKYEYINDCRLNYQRWVPFIRGPWGKTGGNWFSFFGLHFHFRYGKQNKGGWFVPLTKLNISFSSNWVVYKRYKKKKNDRQQRIN